ncbi:large ribosomal subunit protein uL24m [Halyomorpha halys]|uniref:large ribosomal subunit protein uL24m n=1 Tax=Halyomorpha halys TaxID=286706 RepID=UPI0006D4ED96|nr:probable 39S ribosomal protein L24, mitochondrial [Halyomorpha halys]
MRLFSVLYRKFPEVGEVTKKYANLPESYIKKCLEQVEWKTPRGLPQYLPRTKSWKKRYFNVHRPWTTGFQRDNTPGTYHRKVFLEPYRDWSFFKGDRVEILSGPDKGKQGIISVVIQERNWVIVEGLNCKMKMVGKTKKFPGLVQQEEQPLLVHRQVKLVDPADLQNTEIEWRYTEEGDKVRVSLRTGRIIPIPTQAQETYDYKTKKTYKESAKDTTSDALSEVTFSPRLETFEMNIMKSMGLKEERIPTQTYWY